MTEVGVHALQRIEIELGRLSGRVEEVRDKMLQMEARDLLGRLGKLEGDLQKLMNAAEREAGARGLFEWIAKYGPSMAMICTVLILGLLAGRGLLSH